MKIVEVNYTDLDGHIFDGYDLMAFLNRKDHDVWQVVRKKKSDDPRVIEVGYDWVVHEQIRVLEKRYKVENLLFPYARLIKGLDIVRNADILHFHILHNDFVSLFDYPDMFEGKRVVWTIHDPWILTGGCIHPFSCKGWIGGCESCDELPARIYQTNAVRTAEMKKIKEDMWKRISPDIVVSSEFMKKRIMESPMTKHISRVHEIPFGVRFEDYGDKNWVEIKRNRISSGEKLTIGFRLSNDENKGCPYIYRALRRFPLENKVKLIAVGKGDVPEDIKASYEIIELGWCQDQEMLEFWNRIDIFIMPSLAETFGLMAIESMARYVPVICFDDTSVADITEAPQIGVSVKWGSSDDLGRAIEELVDNRYDLITRALAGRNIVEEKYSFESYARRHEQLYEGLLEA